MNRIKYKVNGGKTTNIIHCEIIQENESELTVKINDKLDKIINKSKIIENVDIE